jgi:hypothetical protein
VVAGSGYAACGYLVLGPWSLRVDRLERFAGRARRLARSGPFSVSKELAAVIGRQPEELGEVLGSLGYVARGDGRFLRRPRRRRRRRGSSRSSS